jgi:hypothetical protein
MKILTNNSDRFGYYTVGEQKLYSKLDAIKLHSKTGIHPEWHYHDEVFSSYDWTVEPTQSLEQLYRKRAEQIREKYDYIVLFFSGGADSTNVLDTFINNKIHVDEIATWHFNKGNKNNTTWYDAETTYVAFPKIKELLEVHPEINQRIIDLTDHLHQHFSISDNAEEYIYDQSSMLMPDTFRNRIHEFVPFYRDYILSGKKIGFVWAVDKPRLFFENNRYSLRFLDIFDNCVVSGSGVSAEFFYWSPDLPELLIKQAHVIKRYMENSDANSRFIRSTPTQLASRTIGDKTIWLTNDGVHSLLYSTWDINTFTVGKTPSPIINPATKWFTNLGESDLSRQHWLDLLQTWWNTLPDYWRNDPTNIYKGIKCCLSKNYYLN